MRAVGSDGENTSLGILNREEPDDLVNQGDGEQQEEADIDTGPVREAVIRRAINNLRNGNVPGEDWQQQNY